MAYREYLAEEVALDHHDGLLSRRDALRRLGLLGFGSTAALALLTSCGDDGDGAAPDAPTTVSSPPDASTTTATSVPAAVEETTTSSPELDPPTVERIEFAGPASSLIGFVSEAPAARGAVLIIHENRGLTPHFEALPARFAAAGYTALSIDLLSRVGGTASLADDGAATAQLGGAAQSDLTADVRAGLDELERRHPDLGLAVVGFCFGGAQLWSLLAAGDERLRAAAPFYGPGPVEADFSGSPNAAVLGIYAELDSRVNASRDAMDTALTAAGLTHEIRTFPGVDHAFFNDTGGRYDPTQAAAAFDEVVAWFADHLT